MSKCLWPKEWAHWTAFHRLLFICLNVCQNTKNKKAQAHTLFWKVRRNIRHTHRAREYIAIKKCISLFMVWYIYNVYVLNGSVFNHRWWKFTLKSDEFRVSHDNSIDLFYFIFFLFLKIIIETLCVKTLESNTKITLYSFLIGYFGFVCNEIKIFAHAASYFSTFQNKNKIHMNWVDSTQHIRCVFFLLYCDHFYIKRLNNIWRSQRYNTQTHGSMSMFCNNSIFKTLIVQDCICFEGWHFFILWSFSLYLTLISFGVDLRLTPKERRKKIANIPTKKAHEKLKWRVKRI